MWAIKTRALTQNGFADGLATFMAGLTIAPVHEVLLLKIATFAIAVHKVAQSAATSGNGQSQYSFDFIHQSLALFQSHVAGHGGGQEFATEKGFVGVNIAHTNHNVIVHQGQFQSAFLRAQCGL